MAFSAAAASRSNLAAVSSSQPYCKLCCVKLSGNESRRVVCARRRGGSSSLRISKAVLNDRRSSSINGNNGGAYEPPARILLERLFAQTQKLEEQMSRNGRYPQLGFNLETLECDLHAALAALKQKEEDLQDAERLVVLEHLELNRTKEGMERREREAEAACLRYEKIEEELKRANVELASQGRYIEEMKVLLRKRDQEVAATQSALLLKEEELEKMRDELLKMREAAAVTDAELRSKAQLLNEANEVVKRQDLEIQGLRRAVLEKEEELEISRTQRELEEEKLKISQENLEKQTMEWLLAQEELKKLAAEVSKHTGEANETLEDFQRVKSLLIDVKSELVASQKALASSRQNMEDRAGLMEIQLDELEDQKRSVMSYLTTLKDAHIEVESERAKLTVAEARNKELERELSMEKELMEDLEEVLKKERYSLHQAINEISALQKKLDKRTVEFGEMRDLLHVKEVEAEEAKLEIQHLKSELVTHKLILEEKNLELQNARNKLEEVNSEVAELKMLLANKEEKLVQAAALLKEKDEHVLTLQDVLDDTKLKYSEAETVVERIAELTNKLVGSIKVEEYIVSASFDEFGREVSHQLLEKPIDSFRLQILQLETELESAKDSLREKELEILASRRALTLKDEELMLVLGRLEAKEEEVKKMEENSEDANDLKNLYALAQERLGEKTVGDLAIEKLQLQAAQLEVEAATSALQNLAEMSGEFLNKARLSIEADKDTSTSYGEQVGCLAEVTTEVTRISALTNKLVKEAGIVVNL